MKKKPKEGRAYLLIVAKIVFIGTSYLLNLALMQEGFLGKGGFGLWRSAFLFLSLANNVVVVAAIETVSRFTNSFGDERIVLRKALRYQSAVALSVGALVFGMSFWVSAEQNDPELGTLIRIGSAATTVYALYATCVGSLNGRHLFARQALLDMVFSFLRIVGILGGAALIGGAIGSMLGFSTAALIVFVLGLYAAGVGKAGIGPTAKEWFAYALPLMVYHIARNTMLLGDIQVLKWTVAAAGSTAAVEKSRILAGEYGAAQLFALVPAQLLMALTFAIFPMIVRATKENNHAAARRTLQGALRITIVLLGGVSAPIAGAAPGVLLLGGQQYVGGSVALEILALGLCSFALFLILATAINGIGHALTSSIIALVSAFSVILAVFLLVNRSGLSDAQLLQSTAWGTSIGTAISVLLAASYLSRHFGNYWPWVSTIRVGVAAAIVGLITRYFLPIDNAIIALFSLVAAGILYLFLLFLFGELRRRDLQDIRTMLKK